MYCTIQGAYRIVASIYICSCGAVELEYCISYTGHLLPLEDQRAASAVQLEIMLVKSNKCIHWVYIVTEKIQNVGNCQKTCEKISIDHILKEGGVGEGVISLIFQIL